MKIYTKTGDKGQTSLANGQRVCKNDARILSYGTADELNSFVGLLRCHLQQYPSLDEQLVWVQNKLFNLGAGLAQAPGEWIVASDIQTIEQYIDALQTELPAFQGFVLPGGSESVSLCHVCRTVTRRLECQMMGVQSSAYPPNDFDNYVCFVNRLSDFWYVLAQKCAKNEEIPTIFWKK